jgi:hypothetical protein
MSTTLFDRPTLKAEYGNYIGGKFVAPVDGHYFDVTTPTDGTVITKVSRSNSKDVELALDAAHAAFLPTKKWPSCLKRLKENSINLHRPVQHFCNQCLHRLRRVRVKISGSTVGQQGREAMGFVA